MSQTSHQKEVLIMMNPIGRLIARSKSLTISARHSKTTCLNPTHLRWLSWPSSLFFRPKSRNKPATPVVGLIASREETVSPSLQLANVQTTASKVEAHRLINRNELT